MGFGKVLNSLPVTEMVALTEPSTTFRGNIRDTDSCAGFPDNSGVRCVGRTKRKRF